MQHKEIVYSVQYEKKNAIPWSKLLMGKTGSGGGTKTMRRIILGAGTQAMQQVCPNRLLHNVGSDFMFSFLAST